MAREHPRRRIEREMERRTAEGGSTYLRENPEGRNHNIGVDDRIKALKGRSRNDIEKDDRRGASSPLGHGDKAKKGKQR